MEEKPEQGSEEKSKEEEKPFEKLTEAEKLIRAKII